MVSHWSREGDRILEAWFHQAGRRGSAGVTRRTSRRWSSRPGMLPGRVVQRYSRKFATQFQGIPNGVLLGTNSPEGGRGGPGRPGITPDTGGEWS